MSNTYKIFAGLVIGVCLVAFNAPSISGKPDDTSIKYIGRQRLKSRLRDPSSLEIVSEELIRPGRNGGSVGYQAKFRAKNGFGGHNVETFYTE
jgi:hypothetical protein